MCGYIVAVGMETFVCHVFCCTPHAGTLTRAIEEACKVSQKTSHPIFKSEILIHQSTLCINSILYTVDYFVPTILRSILIIIFKEKSFELRWECKKQTEA